MTTNPATIADLIRKNTAETPDKVALICGDQSLTYAQLDEESNRVAQGLIAAGVVEQDRVAYLDKNGIEYFTLLIGAAKINAVTVAVNWRLAAPEMAYIMNHAGVKVLFIGEEFLGHLDKMELDSDPAVVVLGSADQGSSYPEWVAANEAIDPHVGSAPNDTCYQLYTSGTTGLPKGVELTNSNLFALLPGATKVWEFDSDSINLVVMPLFHIAGSGWGMAGMYWGGTNVILRDIDPVEVIDTIERLKITNALLVPAVLQFMLMMPSISTADFTSLRRVVYGASPITEEVLVGSMNALGCRFCQVYGLTETTGAITQLEPEDHDPGGPRSYLLRSAGKPMPGVEIRIVDEDNNEIPDGEVGEIWCRTGQNLKSYWSDAAATESVFPEGRDENGLGWFRTGDAGYLREGFVFIHDRVKDMIVSGGENIYPAEIENVLMAHEAIADAAVIGIPDEKWGETVKAVIVTAADAEIDDAELISYCRERLAHYKCPTSVDRVDALPRNPSGKILKTEIRAPYWVGRDRMVN